MLINVKLIPMNHMSICPEKKKKIQMILLLWLKAINIDEKRNGTLTT